MRTAGDRVPTTLRPDPALVRLHALRNDYAAAAEQGKRALLTQLSAVRGLSLRQLQRWHDDLLFLRAFPGAAATHRLALRALAHIEARFRALPRRERQAADDTGIAGSTSRHVLPYPVVRWLARVEPRNVSIDWRAYGEPARLDTLLEQLLRAAERDAFASGEFGTREWLDLMQPADCPQLRWLIDAVEADRRHARRLAADWNAAEVPVAWSLVGSRWSVTRNAAPMKQVVLRGAMRRPPPDPAAHVATPLARIDLLPARRAAAYIALARAALAARCREVHAITYASAREVYLADLGEGVQMAVLGLQPAYRLTLEANYGYLLLANGVPIGYGGVTPLFRQANTGINIFESFRGAEAAFVWLQMLRTFVTLFDCRRFIVNAYQFGAGNREAIASGAYWFYYRLGFRPAGAVLRTLAAAEAGRLARRGARSSAATLRRLADGDLHFDLPGWRAADAFPEALLPQLGAAAARRLAQVGAGTRDAAERTLAHALATDLGAGDLLRWPAARRRAFCDLAPLAALAANVATWPASDRRAATAVLVARASAQERDFARAAVNAPRLFHALRDAARALK
jgi:hypothetical protein